MRKLEESGTPPVRTQIVSTQDLIDRINDWRSRQPGVPSKSEAIRKLIERSLASESS